MHRRQLLLAAGTLGALSTPAKAAPATPAGVDVGAVLARVVRLRERMSRAGERTVTRYQRQLPPGVSLPDDLWTTIREGFGALAVVPSLRRMTPEEQETPAAQALLFDVAERVGAYAVQLHQSLGEALAHPHPQHRVAMARALSRLTHHDEDDEFGRSSFLSLRAEREHIHGEVARFGPDVFLERTYADLDRVVTAGRVHMEAGGEVPAPVDGAPRQTVGKTLGRGLAVLVGIALLGAAALGVVWMVASVALIFAEPLCLPLGLVLAVLGGLLMVTAGAAGLGLIQAGRTVGPVKSLDGKRITVNAVAAWKWFATGAQFGATQPKVLVEGAVRVPGRLTGAPPRGLPDTAADATAPAPGLPEYALIARVGEWTGRVAGGGDVLSSARREGELWLSVNVPAAAAATTEGAFAVTVLL